MSERKRKKNGDDGTDVSDDGRRSYRFDPALLREFEDRCELNIYNPRAVLEALMLDWLSKDENHHKELAKKYREWTKKHA